MDVQSYLNPEEEVVQDEEEEIDEHIAARFNPEIEAESDEEVEELPHVTVDEALEALSRLRLFEEQSEDGKPDWITQLNHHERVLNVRRVNRQKQQDIRSFFEPYS